MASFQFQCIDGHTCGNPVRLVVKGHPELKSGSIAEKRLEFIRDHDWIRTGLMFEPRGHDMMSGSFLFPPENPENDFSILFIETSGCLPMCGHGTIGTVTFALEEGLLQPKVPGKLSIEAPAGIIEVEYKEEGNKVLEVIIKNVPAFLFKEGIEVETDSLGRIKMDISYGGNFYGIIEPQGKFSSLDDFDSLQLIGFSREIRSKINDLVKPIHPEDDRIQGLSHIMWAESPESSSSNYRNAVFYGEKAIDRSPCGTGTSARMAQLFAKGHLKENEEFIHESIIGSTFTGKILNTSQVGPYLAVHPQISGWARVTGHNSISIDQDDPFWKGFQVR